MPLIDLTNQPAEQLFMDLFGPAGRFDPYPYYQTMREAGPLMRTPFGTLVFGYDDCQQVIRARQAVHDPQASLTTRGFPDWRQHSSFRLTYDSMLIRNAPDHTRLRRLVGKAFGRAEVEQLQPSIDRIADNLVGRMIDQVQQSPGTAIDLIANCAYQFPVAVIGELLGIPLADQAQFRELVLAQSAVLELLLDQTVVARADEAADLITDYFEHLVRERRMRPRDDLTSKLLAVEDDGQTLTHDELIQTLTLIMGAGFETTSNLIANGVVALIDHPDQLASWRSNPELTGTAIEELLRFDGPAQLLARNLTEDIALPSGGSLNRDELAILVIGAANRDPKRFDHPEQLILDRPEPHPLSFGGGIHYCLGAALARAEAASILTRLMDAFQVWNRAPGAIRRNGLTIRGYTQLPLLLEPTDMRRVR